MPRPALNADEIIARLDVYYDVEFTFIHSEEAAEQIIDQPRQDQEFILNLTQRIAATNEELAFQFTCSAVRALKAMDRHMVEAWAMTATDSYDQKGLFPAMTVIRELDDFVSHARISASGAVLEEEIAVLLPFLQGLSGRKMKIAEADHAYTDTETLYLPPITAVLEKTKDNFLIYKATIAMLWAQVHFGTFRVDAGQLLCEQDGASLDCFNTLEGFRLEACLRRELPGLYRDMQRLKAQSLALRDDQPLDAEQQLAWQRADERLARPDASVHDSLQLARHLCTLPQPPVACYQPGMNLDAVRDVMLKRIEREKAFFRVALGELAREMRKADDDAAPAPEAESAPPQFHVRDDATGSQTTIELELDGELVAMPENVRELATSIIVDFGEIPPEHLFAAGPGEYDLKKYEAQERNPDDVWKGTYHEEGAELYNEWNFKRQHYHKNWCVLRELEVKPEYDDFYPRTLEKHKGLLKSLRHTFEILRGEDKLLKKQLHGDDIDIDALVETWADVASGMEMSDRVFTRMHKEERNVAVIFMVDMSGSTRGWINEAEKESLILLAEVLEILGDRYAIYGFSGMTRKRCELYKIKTFDENYNEEIRARISNIQPQDYTRMGVFIRHATRLFAQIEAGTKLMITLSDGKPDDYDTYRGEYGVEDTRQALYEAHRDGIHAFCITIDEQAREYLPHMYGAANYAVIDDVAQLPVKVADIYRRLTT